MKGEIFFLPSYPGLILPIELSLVNCQLSARADIGGAQTAHAMVQSLGTVSL